jgi:hypothetical protein
MTWKQALHPRGFVIGFVVMALLWWLLGWL